MFDWFIPGIYYPGYYGVGLAVSGHDRLGIPASFDWEIPGPEPRQ